MQVTTIHAHPGAQTAKTFAWSYSKLKNFEECPKRHYHIDIEKSIKEEKSEQLRWGDAVHAAAAAHLAKGTPLPAGMEFLKPWLADIVAGARGDRRHILTECKFACNRDMLPVPWFDRAVWVRAIADVLTLMPPVALGIDWKTGKILEDSIQLQLLGAMLFAHYPDIKRLRTEFVWLKEGATTRVDMSRDDLPAFWAAIQPRIDTLELADLTGYPAGYPAKPGGLCKRWCPVESCEYHGKGSY